MKYFKVCNKNGNSVLITSVKAIAEDVAKSLNGRNTYHIETIEKDIYFLDGD